MRLGSFERTLLQVHFRGDVIPEDMGTNLCKAIPPHSGEDPGHQLGTDRV